MRRLQLVFAVLVALPLGCEKSSEPVTTTTSGNQNVQVASRIDRSRLRMPVIPPPRHPVTRTPADVRGNPSWLPPANAPRRAWKTIVVHHSATHRGNAALFDKFHRDKGWDELGYHFVIGNGTGSRDGAVEVGSRWFKQKHGAHCRTPRNEFNEHGIGICLVGDFTRNQPTPAQLQSLVALTSFLQHAYRIPASAVVSHGEVTGKTQCPGPRLDMHRLRGSLARNPVLATSHTSY